MHRSILAPARLSAAVIAVACSAAPTPRVSDSVALPAAAAAAPAPASTRPDTSSPVPAPAQASFTRILTQRTSGFDEEAERVIRDQAALESAWKTLFNGIPGNAPPAVDFTRETVLLVALGGRSTGGHAVRIDAVSRAGNGAVVQYTATSPGPGCMTTQSLTSPVEVVRTARIEGAVRFERRSIVQPC
jgi:hypothetical protein